MKIFNNRIGKRIRDLPTIERNTLTNYATAHHYSSGKAINITYSEWVFVALSIQHAMNLQHIITCSLSSSKIFFHIISKRVRFFRKELLNIKYVF